ncbi:MAG: MBL fold metallo-hydrolase [Candidatus Micrarchaeota archaeon]
MEIKWLGHASLVIEIGGKKILVDPWFKTSKEPQRLVPSTVQLEDVQNCDLILLTHEHHDHVDERAITQIHSKNLCQVIAPRNALNLLPEVTTRSKIPVTEGDDFNLLGLNIKVVPAKHPQSTHAVGFIVSSPREEKSIYLAGDTYDFTEMRDINVDVAVLPIGGLYTMDSISAVTALKRMHAKYVIPIHFNTFKEITVNERDFEKRVLASTKTKPIILDLGEQVSI